MNRTHPRGIPGLLGTDHIGFTVPDLEQATRFFVDVIGCEYIYSLGPFSDEGEWMSRHLNVHPRAVAKEVRLFRCRHGANFEIFEFDAPDQNRTPPRNSDVGGHHLALYVEDFAAALAYLKDQGVRIIGSPTERTMGPSAGQTWVYFLSPWGMQLELVSFPGGKRYEKESSVILWHPGHPSD